MYPFLSPMLIMVETDTEPALKAISVSISGNITISKLRTSYERRLERYCRAVSVPCKQGMRFECWRAGKAGNRYRQEKASTG